MDNLQAQEKSKYHKMWQQSEYGMTSPVMRYVDGILEYAKQNYCKTILDAGCGNGKFMQRAIEDGFDIIGIDISLNGLINEPYNLVPLCIEAPLHQLECEKKDLVVCCDVLEHVPQEWLKDTLKALSKACKKGFMFSICITDDHFGSLIGEKLHISLLSIEDWIDLIKQFFVVQLYKRVGNDLLVVGTSNGNQG